LFVFNRFRGTNRLLGRLSSSERFAFFVFELLLFKKLYATRFAFCRETASLPSLTKDGFSYFSLNKTPLGVLSKTKSLHYAVFKVLAAKIRAFARFLCGTPRCLSGVLFIIRFAHAFVNPFLPRAPIFF
jgi:hypothetical protein